MAHKRMKLDALLLGASYVIDGWELVTPATAAEMLEIHEKHVFRLVRDGHLERREIIDRKGRTLAIGISEDSVLAYRKSQRRKRQLDLLGDVT